MASTASGRGRPAILSKTDLDLGDGGSAVLRLVGEGDTVQIELPKSWSLDSLQRSATQSGGRTKVTFVLDGDKPLAATNGHTNGSAPADAAPVAEKTPRKTATKKAATPEQPAAPATASKTRRTRKTAAASPVSATV